MEAAEVLEGAIEEIRKRGWWQGQLTGPGGSVCVRGAMRYAAFDSLERMIAPNESVFLDADDFLMAAAEEVGLKIENSVYLNDHVCETEEDIIHYLELGAKVARRDS